MDSGCVRITASTPATVDSPETVTVEIRGLPQHVAMEFIQRANPYTTVTAATLAPLYATTPRQRIGLIFHGTRDQWVELCHAHGLRVLDDSEWRSYVATLEVREKYAKISAEITDPAMLWAEYHELRAEVVDLKRELDALRGLLAQFGSATEILLRRK